MNRDMSYWVWLQRAAGKGANLEKLLTPFGGDVRALYETAPAERARLLREAPTEAEEWPEEDLRSGGLRRGHVVSRRAEELQKLRTGQLALGGSVAASRGRSARKRKQRPVAESTLERMKKVSLAEAEETLELCERTGVTMLCPTDPAYPALLRELPNLPAVLYALGDTSVLEEPVLPLAMVGARDARLTSLSAASLLAESLARVGFLIVSGGAIGTDGACHIGALNAGRPTVAVLGTGIGTNYLQQNADLRRVISHNGVLLSEMEPGEPGSKGSFPLRNRIIAGMSVGTVVVEAAVKSGSLITSKYAEEFSRDVFVPLFPGVDPEGTLGERFPSFADEEAPEREEKPVLSQSQPTSYSNAFRGGRELVERDAAYGVRCAGDVLAVYADSYGLDPAVLVAEGRVTAEELTRDITDLPGVFPPLLSQPMVVRARRQLGSDLAGGGPLNPTPGWGPYRTAEDADLRTYTSAEFAYRRGDHPHTDRRSAPPVEGALARKEEGGDHETPTFEVLTGEHASPNRPREDLTSEALLLLDCFWPDPEKPRYYDDFEAATDMATQFMLAALTELQLAGYVDLMPDGTYRCTLTEEGRKPI